jgi:hypothetical protein
LGHVLSLDARDASKPKGAESYPSETAATAHLLIINVGQEDVLFAILVFAIRVMPVLGLHQLVLHSLR